MQRIIAITLMCVTLCCLYSCSVIDTDLIGDLGDKVKNEAMDVIQKLPVLESISATGEVKNNPVNMLNVYDDKIVITIATDTVRESMEKSGITVETIQAERKNAETAHMDYTLAYEYYIQLKINETHRFAACQIDISEDTLEHTVDISIPIKTNDMGVTIYNLLQGEAIHIEGYLKHGTDSTPVTIEKYYLDKIPENTQAVTLTMTDHRKNA